MIKIKKLPLNWHIEKLKYKEHFAFPRYGDGEWRAILRGTGIASARLQPINEKIQTEMIRDLVIFAKEPQVFFGLQRYANTERVFGNDIEKFLHNHRLKNITWINADVFHHASSDGLLYPLIEQLRKMKIVVVGPNLLRKIRENIFDYCAFIEVPEKNCYSKKGTIRSEILDIHQITGENVIYSFCCGLLAETLILNSWKEMPKNFFIDFGSLWDVFCGWRSRGYTKNNDYTDHILRKNLGME